MITDSLKQLQEYRQRVAKLESKVAGELKALPSKFGFDSMEEFIEALRNASGGQTSARSASAPARRGRKPGPRAAKTARPSAAAPRKAGKNGRKPRTTITDEIKTKVKTLTQAGKTGAEIAEELDISVPSVHNIKKALGLVKARK